MTYTSQQAKGWRHENKTKKTLEAFSGEGTVYRAPMSGSYTGETDLKWTLGHTRWEIDCKWGKDWKMKRHRDRLEGSDMCIDCSPREIPLITMPLPKFIALCEYLLDKDREGE